jgi:hypothetical protein
MAVCKSQATQLRRDLSDLLHISILISSQFAPAEILRRSIYIRPARFQALSVLYDLSIE